MSEEKAEALRQINDIKNHLVDKQTFFPYNYNATYVWAVIATILVQIMIPMYEASILQGTLVSFVLISIGFMTEGFLTKKVNQSYDIEDCTLRQRFIMKSFLFISLFLMVISAIFASYKLYAPMFLTWLILVSLGYFSVGFVLNIRRFRQMAVFNMLVAIGLLVVGVVLGSIEGTIGVYLYLSKAVVIFGLAILPSFIAWQQLKERK